MKLINLLVGLFFTAIGSYDMRERQRVREKKEAQSFFFSTQVFFFLGGGGGGGGSAVQWLSGKVLDLRPRGHRFEPNCVVSLSKTHLSLLSTGSTQEDPSRNN